MDIQIASQMAFGVIGGLGIFLLGMKNMSEGMQAVAGNRLRKLISAVTQNRLVACGVGTAVTCLIQSSSVTTVMVVGMVNASLMTLHQAIGIILGANIGTTITGWILVLKIGKYGLPILGISAFFYLFSKRDRVRFTASVFMGLGMVFFGLELMKHGFGPLRDMPEFINWFSRFSPDNYLGVLKCCMVGALLTAIVQSSSATLGITMGLASTGVIDYSTAAALVLGENIGTTITAYLASLGAGIHARRAAYAHIMVNVLGVIVITALFPLYTKVILFALDIDPSLPVLGEGGIGAARIMQAIAATHTGFNVVNAFIWLPLMGMLERFLCRMAPEKAVKEKPHLRFLDVRILDTPAIGIEQSRKEIMWMGSVALKMLRRLRNVLEHDDSNKPSDEKIFKNEKKLDIVQKEVVEYLSKLVAGNISHDVMISVRQQLRMADEYESISDYITSILKLRLKLRDSGETLHGEGLEEILDLHEQVSDYLSFINTAAQEQDGDILESAKTLGATITRVMKEYRSKHLARVENGSASAFKSLVYTDILNAYRRIKDHAFNIAEVLAGEK